MGGLGRERKGGEEGVLGSGREGKKNGLGSERRRGEEGVVGSGR